MWNYQTEFETLSSRVLGLPLHPFLSCLISGLKPPISREVQALQPISLMHAIGWAKIQEEKYLKMRKYQRISSNYSSNYQPSTVNSTAIPSTTQPFIPKAQPSILIKRLSSLDLRERRDKILCYTCDEKFEPGHKCKSRFFLLLHQDDDLSDLDTSPLDDFNIKCAYCFG